MNHAAPIGIIGARGVHRIRALKSVVTFVVTVFIPGKVLKAQLFFPCAFAQ